MPRRGARGRIACAVVLIASVALPVSGASAHGAPAWMPRPGTAGARAAAAPSLALEPFATVSPTVPPSVGASPPAQVDEILSVNPGTWPGPGWTFAYQWLDCDPANASLCVTIAGATSGTYMVDPLDGGSTLEVQVAANDGAGDTGSATTAPTPTVVAQPGAPVVQTGPSVQVSTGGGVVSATGDPGTWANAPSAFSYLWLSCLQAETNCVPVGSDQPTYTPVPSDNQHVLVVVVVASNATGDSVAVASSPSSPVAMPPTISISSPAAGSYAVGATVTAQYGCTPAPGTTVTVCNGYADPAPPFCNLSGVFAPCGPAIASGSAVPTASSGFQQFEVVAVDADGGSSSTSVNYIAGATLPAPPPRPAVPTIPILTTTPPASVTTPPPLAVTALAQSGERWREKAPPGKIKVAPVGDAFTFATNVSAKVTFTFVRHATGRRVHGRCAAPTRANRHRHACARDVAAGSVVATEPAGTASVRFNGVVAGAAKPLAPGSYTATVSAQASDGSGTMVGVGTLSFTIVK